MRSSEPDSAAYIGELYAKMFNEYPLTSPVASGPILRGSSKSTKVGSFPPQPQIDDVRNRLASEKLIRQQNAAFSPPAAGT